MVLVTISNIFVCVLNQYKKIRNSVKNFEHFWDKNVATFLYSEEHESIKTFFIIYFVNVEKISANGLNY